MSSGFRFEDRNGIYIYFVSAVDRATVDAMYELGHSQNRIAAETTGHLMRVWVIEKLLFPTPYVKEKLSTSIQATADHLVISTALVLSDTVAFWGTSMFLRRVMTTRRRTDVQIFKTLEQALEWMEKRRALIASDKEAGNASAET